MNIEHCLIKNKLKMVNTVRGLMVTNKKIAVEEEMVF